MPIPIVTAAYRHLMASGVVSALVADGLLGADPAGGPYESGWAFSGAADNIESSPRNPGGTGKSALVLYSYDHWAAATMFHTLEYPRLHLAIYADCSRDSSGNRVKDDGDARAYEIWQRISPLFHDPGNQIHAFDDLRVISTLEGESLSIDEVPSGDGMMRAHVLYDITLG